MHPDQAILYHNGSIFQFLYLVMSRVKIYLTSESKGLVSTLRSLLSDTKLHIEVIPFNICSSAFKSMALPLCLLRRHISILEHWNTSQTGLLLLKDLERCRALHLTFVALPSTRASIPVFLCNKPLWRKTSDSWSTLSNAAKDTSISWLTQ